MLDLLFLLHQATWLAFGVTCLVILAILLCDGVRNGARRAKARPLLQVNAARARHA